MSNITYLTFDGMFAQAILRSYDCIRSVL